MPTKKTAKTITQAIKEATLYVTCACITEGYKPSATFGTMGLDAGVRINLQYEIEFLLDTEINDIEITGEMTPDGLTKLLVEKFGK